MTDADTGRSDRAERVAVITDSSASLEHTVAERLGVRVVPMRVVVGDMSYDDGTLDAEEVVRRSMTETITTSAPSPGEFLKVVEEARDDGFEHALIVTVSSRMSGSFDAACTAASYLPREEVTVFDSGSAAGAQGLIVLEAAHRACSPTSPAQVVASARRVADSVRLTASLPNLDYLARSGRVPGLAAWAGRTTGVRPIFSFAHGRVRPRRPALSLDAATERFRAECRQSRPDPHARLHAAVLTSGSEEDAVSIERVVSRLDEEAESFVGKFSSVMVAHTGPGLLGLGWWWDPSPDR